MPVASTIHALARATTAAPGAQVPRASCTIRTTARTATYVPARPRHRRSSTIHSLVHGNRTGPANPPLGIGTTRAYARSNASSSSIAPAVMRYDLHTCTHDNNRRRLPRPSRDTPSMTHGTAAPPPQHVSCMKMRYASWLDWTNVFSLGAGDKHGRDSQAD